MFFAVKLHIIYVTFIKNLLLRRWFIWHVVCFDKGKCISSSYIKTRILVFLPLPFNKKVHVWPGTFKHSRKQMLRRTYNINIKRALRCAPLFWHEPKSLTISEISEADLIEGGPQILNKCTASQFLLQSAPEKLSKAVADLRILYSTITNNMKRLVRVNLAKVKKNVSYINKTTLNWSPFLNRVWKIWHPVPVFYLWSFFRWLCLSRRRIAESTILVFEAKMPQEKLNNMI